MRINLFNTHLNFITLSTHQYIMNYLTKYIRILNYIIIINVIYHIQKNYIKHILLLKKIKIINETNP